MDGRCLGERSGWASRSRWPTKPWAPSLHRQSIGWDTSSPNITDFISITECCSSLVVSRGRFVSFRSIEIEIIDLLFDYVIISFIFRLISNAFCRANRRVERKSFRTWLLSVASSWPFRPFWSVPSLKLLVRVRAGICRAGLGRAGLGWAFSYFNLFIFCYFKQIGIRQTFAGKERFLWLPNRLAWCSPWCCNISHQPTSPSAVWALFQPPQCRLPIPQSLAPHPCSLATFTDSFFDQGWACHCHKS